MKDRIMLDLGKKEPSEFEATSMATLMLPLQREEIAGLCRQLKTTPAVETAAMFGDGVDFYRLTRTAARALAIALQNALAGK